MSPLHRYGALGSIFLALVSIAHGDALVVQPTARSPSARVIGGGSRGSTRALAALSGGGAAAAPEKDDATAAATRAGRVVAVSAGLGSLLQGYDTGVVGGALLFMVPEFGLSAWTVGLVVTASTAGSVLGTLAAAKLSDAIGRRGTMRVASLLFLSAASLLLWSPTVDIVLAGRLLMGGAIGVSGSVVPVYIAECAESRNRGALATVPQLCISTGILCAYASALAVTVGWHGAWRLMLGLALLPAVAQAACVQWLLPESPRWLLRQSGPLAAERAKHALARLRGVQWKKQSEANDSGGSVPLPPAVAAEFAALAAGVAREKQTAAGGSGAAAAGEARTGFGALWREPALRKLALTCAGLQAFQQLSGINAVVAFTPQTLKSAGVPQLFAQLGVRDDNAAALLATTLAYLPKIPALLVAMKLMDGLGRRALLLTFIPAMGVCLAAMAAAVSGALGTGAWAGAAALAATCLYGVVFVLSLGPVPNILTAELFPARVRSAAMACSLGAQFGANALVGLAFPVLRARYGADAVFAGFAGVCALAWAFVHAFVPETKGKALEDLGAEVTQETTSK